MINEVYKDDGAISISLEEEIGEHSIINGLNSLEMMSKSSVYVDIQKAYKIPSTGFIDTAKILTDSEHKNIKEHKVEQDCWTTEVSLPRSNT